LFALAACSDPLAPGFTRYTLDVAPSDCWSAFAIDFRIGPHGIGETDAGGRVVADAADPADYVAFYPASGGSRSDVDVPGGTFHDPHGALTGGGACVAGATLARR